MSHSSEPRPMTSRASGPLTGEAQIPGDKSISHRALILGALSVGETTISGLLEGQDVLDTAAAMAAFGARVERQGPGDWIVSGVGVGGFAAPEAVIDCGNSGTGVRLIMGAMATTPITAIFTGDASLSRRPMARVTDPLSQFGARITAREGGRLPITIEGARDPLPIRYRSPVASAQIKSAILLAGLNAPGETVVIEPEQTRDHSERMLAGFGARIHAETTAEGHVVTLQGRPELRAQPVSVPRDPSSAAFPVAAALIVPGSRIRVPGVSRNPTRDGLYITLRDMGADIAFENPRLEGGEPVADLVVAHGPLHGVEVPAERASSMIDEFPILSVIAAFAKGKTVMNGVSELRVKESDRIDAMARGLEANGVRVEETRDSMTVHGAGSVRGGGSAVTHLDHRIAMSFLILGLATDQPVGIDDAGPIATSFPDFIPLMTRLGATIEDS